MKMICIILGTLGILYAVLQLVFPSLAGAVCKGRTNEQMQNYTMVAGAGESLFFSALILQGMIPELPIKAIWFIEFVGALIVGMAFVNVERKKRIEQ